MTTQCIFRDDPYAQEAAAAVIAVEPGKVRLDRTVFYPMGGGQPGDTGTMRWDGGESAILDTLKGDGLDDIVHIVAEDSPLPTIGGTVTVLLDWDRRHRLMRMHTAMHLMCSLVEGDVTGGQVGAEKSRLDFNIPSGAIDKEALGAAMNALVEAAHPVTAVWITDDELDANPALVRTLSVKPPRGSGRIRLLRIGDSDGPVDLQPCGGTHVNNTREIGKIEIGKVENKGRQNRRINIRLAS